MRIPKVHLRKLRNEEFFQYFTEFKSLVERRGMDKDISEDYALLLKQHSRMDAVLEIVRKSRYTEDITKIDAKRNTLLHGLRATVKSFLFHFDESKQRTATVLMSLLDTYGDLSNKKTYAEQTASVGNLIDDLNTKYVNEKTQLGLQDWVEQLRKANEEFQNLMQRRDNEKSLLPKERVADIRVEMEVCYVKIVHRLEALSILQNSEALIAFINELNVIIDRYRNMLATREGRKKTGSEENKVEVN
jgi:hypothetical protein